METRKYTQEEIAEMERQAEERSEAISRALYEFNRMLQRREKPREECYTYLFEQEREINEQYGLPCTFEFLYPEWIFEVEDTYELHKQKMKKWSEQYKSVEPYMDEIFKLQK